MKKFLPFNIISCLIRSCIVLFLPCLLLCSACRTNNAQDKQVSVSGFMLNTYVSITLYGTDDEDIAAEALNLCSRYEQIFSRTIPDSDLSQLNADKQLTFADDDLYKLIDIGLYYGNLTDGALDITVEPLISLWDITGSSPHVPESWQIQEKSSYVNYQNVTLTDENHVITLNNQASLDLGAIAKGYIADKIRDFLIENGVTHGIISLGGNILCIQGKPDGSDFIIGIQKPFDEAAATVLTLRINDMSVVTSGIYERYFTENNQIYHHIIDPKTGYPSESGLVSVTILSDDSVTGDCLSTACLIMGKEKALKLLDSMDGVYGILIDEQMNIVYSEGASQFVR